MRFNYPLLLSCVHSISNYATTTILMRLFYRHRPSGESYVSYLQAMGLTAICGVLDIGLSNASLQYISLSFYTIIKSIVPVWVLLFSVMFGFERMKMNIFAVIVLMCLGVAFTSMGEIKFSWLGFILIQSAAMTSGLRWSLTQVLLAATPSKEVTLHKPFSGVDKATERREKEKSNPVLTLNRLSPIMAILFAIGTVWLESRGPDGWWNSPFFRDTSASLRTLSFIEFGAILALLMTLAQFYVVLNTSVLTLSVAGVFKVIFTVFVSILWFGDTMTFMGFLGLFISSLGVGLYSVIKYQESQPAKKEKQ